MCVGLSECVRAIHSTDHEKKEIADADGRSPNASNFLLNNTHRSTCVRLLNISGTYGAVCHSIGN
jgi:hypothetical protein